MKKKAIETIVTNKRDVDILWLVPSLRTSVAERAMENKIIEEHGLRFGVTFRDGENAKVQFLHRTYAEYLVAEYLFDGFRLDDLSHNGLLDSTAARDFMVHKLLVKDEYDGVRIFLDSMLRTITASEEWLGEIRKGIMNKLPDRLKKLAKSWRSFKIHQYQELNINFNKCSALYDFVSVLEGKNGLRSTLNAYRFQLNLLTLFVIRGIDVGSSFQLRATFIPQHGGKFDNVIFRYRIDTPSQDVQWRYRYLKVIYEPVESKQIEAADLLNDNFGDFSLSKYCRSYSHDIIRETETCLPESVQDCIVCTNIGFDKEDLQNNGIALLEMDPITPSIHTSNWNSSAKDILIAFENVTGKKPAWYKLNPSETLRKKMREWSDIHRLAKELLEHAIEGKKLNLRGYALKNCHAALINENVIEKVIDSTQAKLHQNFLRGGQMLTTDANKFRDVLSNLTFIQYWGKLALKDESPKKRRRVQQKRLEEFDGKCLNLPKYSNTEMEMDFTFLEEYSDDLAIENVLDTNEVKKTFTKNFIEGINISEKVLQFRTSLCNSVFIHFWKDLTFRISATFGNNKCETSDEDNKSLANFFKEKDIDEFLNKLVFSVNTPKEFQLNSILTEKADHRPSCDLDFILRTIQDLTKKKDSQWVSFRDAKRCESNIKRNRKELRANN